MFAVVLAIGLILAVVFELLIITTWNGLLHVFAIVGILTFPGLVFALIYRRLRMVAVWALAVSAVLALYALPWHPRKRFAWDLYTVKPGMNVAEVESIMGGYIKGAGTKWGHAAVAAYPEDVATATGIMNYRWNATDWDYDSDWGQVEFVDGRVVRVEFLPD